MAKWLKPLTNLFKAKEPVFIATKQGQDVLACFGVLNLSGSAFCLDNKNILFKNDKGEAKILKPFYTVEADNDNPDFTVKETPDGFFVHYKDVDYFYLASFRIHAVGDTKIFKITNVKQNVYGATVVDNKISVNADFDGYPENISVKAKKVL